MKRKKVVSSGVMMGGFYRVKVVDKDGKVSGDSGYTQNAVTNVGLSQYIAYAFASAGGSTRLTQPAYMNLGSSSYASSSVSSATNISAGFPLSAGPAVTVTHITRAASSDGHTVRFTATFISSNCFTTTCTIACIGLFHTTNATSAMCVGSFASSTLGSAQNVNATYDIVFTASVQT